MAPGFQGHLGIEFETWLVQVLYAVSFRLDQKSSLEQVGLHRQKQGEKSMYDCDQMQTKPV